MAGQDSAFGRLMKDFLFFVGKTETELSAEIGLSLNKVSAAMKGRYQLKKDHLDRLVEALTKWGVVLTDEDRAQLLALWWLSVDDAAISDDLVSMLMYAMSAFVKYVPMDELIRDGWLATSSDQPLGSPIPPAVVAPPQKEVRFHALLQQLIDNWCGATGTLRGAAAAIGIDPVTLSQYARGWSHPYYEATLQRVMDGLELVDDDRAALLAAWQRDLS